ncbi:MAG: hypothetical protein ORN21_03715, partial [Methylophilaceae bacterium]|nr:hypothetical protein [Methylophilaceae bacterium]
MSNSTQLVNSFSTGGGGVHFEGQVQASFVVLMLTGGCAPCLPCWPIKEIKLQGRIEGFHTDDLIVVVEDVNSKEQWKLLGQIKHSIAIVKNDIPFGKVMQSAWKDFNNPDVFAKDQDVIVLITGHLTKTNAEVAWIFNHARANRNDPQRFFTNIKSAKFVSNEKRQKLEVIREHLKVANGGKNLSDNVFHSFLVNFYLLGYDLGEEEGVVLSLINSHISQFVQEHPRNVWSRILEFTNNQNQHAGRITKSNLPNELLEALKPKPVVNMPEAFKASQERPETDWTQHPDATYLALAVLIGAWQDKNQFDHEAITRLLGISYEEWLNKVREILHRLDSPLSFKNGTWKVVNRIELLKLLGSRIFDDDVDKFRILATSVLKELDPAFELPAQERYMASIHGKVLKYSQEFREGIAEGLAILGNHTQACVNCSPRKGEDICTLVINELLTNANWVLWGSLNRLLPILAEAAPDKFISAVENALSLTPCPFDELFSQESNGVTGGNYLTGLLWALEGLAWDEQYLVRVCVVLGGVASHDPGGQWVNRPFNSLTTILLPWYPQTLASVDKRTVAVKTLLKECPDIAWKLIIQLLPNQRQTSSGSHKPSWFKTIPNDEDRGVTQQEYWQQASCYAELAVTVADQNISRLSELMAHFDKLPPPAFDKLINVLSSQTISELTEEQRLLIWNPLKKFTHKHRKYSDANWALPD